MKSLFIDSFREIKARYKIFISILFMALLGVGFFAGIKATSPDMRNTLESYYEDLNVMDIMVVSPSGLTENDLSKVLEVDNVEQASLGYSYDMIVQNEDKEYAFKVLSYDEVINKIKLVEGKMPENSFECVVDHYLIANTSLKVGDTLLIEDPNSLLKEKELKIVGVVHSPLYLSRSRGNTSLLSGTIDYFLYTSVSNFSYPVYTTLNITLEKNYSTFSDEYDELVSEVSKSVSTLNPSWYVLNRNHNEGFVGFVQDTQRVENIAKVFPLIFFIVATLISLTSMTRMVEEQRIQIGTLKALGYNKFLISLKYILYASLATIIGGIVGSVIGMRLIPSIIFTLYEMMYTVKDLMLEYHLNYLFIGLGMAYLCIVGATVIACLRELKTNPAELMRPKPPKFGKRVLLEKIPWLWNKFSFIWKVTFRNMFRYKKRFLMTIIGIAGCTGLIFAGFGLKESVSGLLPLQYEEIFLYDFIVTANKSISDDDVVTLKSLNNVDGILRLRMESISVASEDEKVDENIHLVAVNKENIKDYITIRDTNEKIVSLEDNGVYVTKKLASLLQIKKGDTVSLITSDNSEKEVIVQEIVDNYLAHYVYLSDDYYQSLYGNIEYNTLLLNTEEMTEDDESSLMMTVLENDQYSKVVSTKETSKMMDDTMQSMNSVVWILIVSAGILAFAVLYNLANVNISERSRELSTIKVLGFYDNEVYTYVSRETIILTVIGIILGLGMGYFLNMLIIKTCELDMFLFPVDVSIWCYLYSIVITTVFTLIVSVLTYFSLKKVDMVESLKSIE